MAELGEGGASLNRTALGRMTFLDAIIKETLRLTPPVGGGFRRVIKAFELESVEGHKVTVPAGAKLLYSIGLTHYVKDLPEASSFDPQRFVGPPSTSTGSSSTTPAPAACPGTAAIGTVSGGYCPFAAGRRACLGMPLAKLELKIFGALFLRTLKFVKLENPEAKWTDFPIPKPKDGLQIQVELRKSNQEAPGASWRLPSSGPTATSEETDLAEGSSCESVEAAG